MSTESPTPAADSPPRPPAVGQAMARYLFAISRNGDGADRVTTGDIQSAVGVTPASVTEMLGKLDEAGLADYEKYDGVVLTDAGEEVAARTTRRFCAVTTFFESVLDADLDREVAFEIGYLLPEDSVTRLRAINSAACPEYCPERGHPDGSPV
ncbi:MarR family transcriptional regulator [Halovenus sp. WSH3]|uniref:MarR family transcriptional regulator n=1 Tax=Halovenus carboxidivorans TaxID=2692199 RepID=A0A6B0T2R5_9EURY|nr:metal-dependent transcriptional regulator [Halovenus carboxidivorans]MXR52334.1 MarR family transcriptional regulator [Halovenus carboxidivorans]